MKSITVYHYDAFSNIANMGNPAGVVFNGDELTDDEMQEIALKVGFNETSFPIKSDIADFRIRYFTPGHEINLCGHATVATVYALKTRGLLADKEEFLVETKAGLITVSIWQIIEDLEHNQNHEYVIKMQQTSPLFKQFNGSKQQLMEAIGLKEDDLDERYPIMYGNTGTWTLLVPIKKLHSFYEMKPNNVQFPSILTELPRCSIHPFTLETEHNFSTMHARHFSSPYSGTIEDPVTGTASGVMGVYYSMYIDDEHKDELSLIVEQGQEIGRDGRVLVKIIKHSENYDVYVLGKAVFVTSFEINI